MNLVTFVKKIIKVLKRKEYIPVVISKDEKNLFDGKVALVVGGSGGIGFAIAQRLVSQGSKVIITGTNELKLKRLCDELNLIHEGFARCLAFDMTNLDMVEKNINKCVKLFDDNKIDILVNSAGVNSESTIFNVSELEYDRIMNTNLKGAYFISIFVAKIMVKNKTKGHILNVSSASSLRPAALPYAISKWGMRGMTLGLADELIKYNIIVNAIGPGPVATLMNGRNIGDSIAHPSNPSGRCATVEEIAELACYLVSDKSNMVVGDTFFISGGGGTTSLHR